MLVLKIEELCTRGRNRTNKYRTRIFRNCLFARLQAGWQKSHVSIHNKATRLSCFAKRPGILSWAPSFILNGSKVAPSLMAKRLDREAYHCNASSVEVGNRWSCTQRYHTLFNGVVLNILATDFFFQILAHPVFKMWILQEPNKVALRNKRHLEEKKWRLYSMFKIFSTDICWINIKWCI